MQKYDLLRAVRLFAIAVVAMAGGCASNANDADMLTLHARSQVAAPSPSSTRPTYAVVEKAVHWDPKTTAIVIIDMWDDHWCKGAAARVGELAGPMNQMVQKARDEGVFIVHCPSSVTSYYKDTPQRKLAQTAPFAKAPIAFSTVERWGTMWCYPDKSREPDMPIDDSDMGCDCKDKKCEIREAWKHEISTIQIADGDAITDDGQELYNLLAQRGIDKILIMGVHLNMCVLGRPVAIRQMVSAGKQVILVRDMTDTMYNHKMKPFVNHFAGTDLVVDHVEKYWCPTILSTDITGQPPFRFKEDVRPQ